MSFIDKAKEAFETAKDRTAEALGFEDETTQDETANSELRWDAAEPAAGDPLAAGGGTATLEREPGEPDPTLGSHPEVEAATGIAPGAPDPAVDLGLSPDPGLDDTTADPHPDSPRPDPEAP